MKESGLTAELAIQDTLPERGELFRRMAESARDAIIVLDQKGLVSFWNKATADMLGYPLDEIPRQEMYLWLIPERLHDVYWQGFRHFRETGEWVGIEDEQELVAVRSDGEELPVEVSISSVKLKGRSYALGIMRDITERKRMEKELSLERNLFHSLMEHSVDAIYFKDLESRFIRCSHSLKQRFQDFGMNDVHGKTDHDYFSAEHADDALRDEQEIIRTGEPLIGKVEKETWPDGRVTWVLTSKKPFRNKEGEIVGTFGISKDITAIKEAELKLDTLHELVEASRQAGMAEMATSVLHNIGNVVTSVNVSSSLIAERIRFSKCANLSKVVALLRAHAADLPDFLEADPKGRQLPGYLEQLAAHLEEEREALMHETGALSGKIQHIKEIIAMQQGAARSRGMVETLSVADLVEDALWLNLGAVERHDIELEREYAPVPPVSVEKHKVLQILVNLVRNAMNACDDSGRADKKIMLRIAREGEARVAIFVEDNGVGIAQENLTRIFNFGFTTRLEGHGFGLHSGALAAKDLGGTLKAFSNGLGQGAVFTLELPVQTGRRK